MRAEETFELLAKLSAYDQRTVGEADALAFTEALVDVTIAEALEAVPVFYRSETAQRRRANPADIVAIVKLRRRQASEQAFTAAYVAEQRQARLAPASGSHELEMLHDAAMEVACPGRPLGCGQPMGVRCVNEHTGLASRAPHGARLRAAGHSSVTHA